MNQSHAHQALQINGLSDFDYRRDIIWYIQAFLTLALLLIGGWVHAATPMIAAGANHSIALKSNGTVWAWGGGGSCQLGLSSCVNTSSPQQITALNNINAVASGWYHSLAVKASDGSVWSWGGGSSGQLGNGGNASSSSPVQVSGLSGIAMIAGGSDHSLAVGTNGTVWAWGGNSRGQLGSGNTSSSFVPIQITALLSANIIAVAAGESISAALSSDGSVWYWGSFYSFGGTDRLTPVKSTSLSGISSISTSGGHLLARQSNGNVWAWGANGWGQLGNGGTSSSPVTTPALVSSVSNVAAVSAGQIHSMGATSDGAVYVWGGNSTGQLGLGDTANRTSPTLISGVSGIVGVTGGENFSLAWKADGTVFGWGGNGRGELGVGRNTNSYTPVQIPNFSLISGAANNPPVASNGTMTVTAGASATSTLAGSDPDGNTLTYSIVAQPAKGSVSINPSTGVATYTVNSNTSGTDSFTFRVYDGAAYSNTATVSVTIRAANRAPVAQNLSFTVADESANTSLLLNQTLQASDPDGDALTYSIVSPPSRGTATLSPAGSAYFTYSLPNVNANGTVTFQYKANDGVADSNIATVTIVIDYRIYRANIPPVAAFTLSPPSGAAPLDVTFDASASTDSDGQVRSYAFVISRNGTEVMTFPVSIDSKVVTGRLSQPGTYDVVLTVTDNFGATGTARKTVTVGTNLPPVIVATATPLQGQVPLTVTLDGSGTRDPEGGSVTCEWIRSDGPVISGCNSQTTIFDQPGTFTLLFKAYDSVLNRIEKSFTVTVGAKITSAPTITGISPSVATVNQPTTFRLTGTDFPVGMVVRIDGCLSYNFNNFFSNATEINFQCIPSAEGVKAVVGTQTNGIAAQVVGQVAVTVGGGVVGTLAKPAITITPPSPVPAGTTITLSFPPVTGAKSYNLYYGTASGKYTASTPVQLSNSFTVQANWDLYVVVKAVDGNGVESAASNEVHIVAAKATGINKLILSTAILDFSDSELNTSSAEKIVLTNKGGSSVTFKKMAISGADATSFSQTTTCGSTLSSNASCEVSVVFTPNQVGDKVAILDIDIGESANYTVALTGFGDLLGDQKAEFEVVEMGATSDYSLSFTLNPQPDSVTGKVFISYLMKSKYAFLTSSGWEWYDPAKATKPITDFFYSNGALDGFSATVMKNVNLKTLPTGKLAVAYIDQNGRLRVSTLMAFKEGRAINAARSASGSNGFSDWFSMCQDYDLRCFTFEKDGVSKTQIDDTLQPPVRGLASFVIKHPFVHYESGGVHLTKAIASASLAALAYWPKDNAVTDNMAEYVKQTGIGKLDFVFVDYSDKETYSRSYKDIDGNDAIYSYTPNMDGNKKALGFQFLTGRIISKAAGAFRQEIEAVGKRGHIEYIVAIRGTDNGLDLDLDALGAKRRTDFRNLGAEYPVHAGYSFYADEVIDRDEFKDVIKRLNGKLCNKVFSCGLTIVGHSLGGATSTLVRAYLVKEFIDRRSLIKPEQIEVYTFGSPIPFASKKNGAVPSLQVFSDNSYRFVNTSDPVPKLGITSGDCTAGMDSKCHVGKQYYFYDDGDEYGYIDIDAGEKLETGFDVVDSDGFLSTHAITSYIGILDAFKKTKKGLEVTKGAVRRFF